MSTPTNLVLLTFGDRLETHYQAALSILSFLNDPHINKVVVVTDRQDFYRCFGDHVEFVAIDETTLSAWQGEQQFFWRVKIKALQTVAERFCEHHILYVDSDTVLGAPLTPLIDGLNRQQPFMHIFEERLSEGNSKTVRKMWKCLQNRTFSGITINENTAMWNAGVIALPHETAHEILALALTICDEICATDCPRRLVEQFAFSLALNHHRPLQGCEHIIAHYWGNKAQWNVLAQDLLLTAFLHHESLEQMKARAAELPVRSVPIFVKTSNTEKRLIRFIQRLFKRNQQRYFNSQE
ncbi:hypothetical protein HPC38_03265 [Pasteurellaceae bacterium HPA106]|uniref:hypothetical protein n=1 Tax=Spirabiliibacterium pneumoniae TaxID=221400 RepID=UPI001AAC5B5F|nr:hypothetical protein [Spirabiliibacterium pneumoniae]MBE2895901.1 hypothetical protein [Spirabiliibacterium pneumoniae]